MAYLGYKMFALLPYIGLPEDPSIIMEHNRLLFLIYCLGPVGILEEFFKFLPFLLVIIKRKSFDEKIDGIVYASIIALGFASYENLHYLAYLDGFALYGRAIASPLTHTVFASIWGYFVGVAYIKGKSLWHASLKGLLISAFCHGLFDFLTTSPTLRVVSALVILVIWLWVIRTMEKLAAQHEKKDKELLKKEKQGDKKGC
jgi:protease PrsW